MSTPHRTAINRANAQHSTGPKTEAGKKKSSLNAVRHGLTGQIVVMPNEDLEAYRIHLKSLMDECDPKGSIEAILVQALADCSWRLIRVAALETNLLTLGIANGCSPVTDAPSQVVDALSIVSALESQSKALSNLSLHSQRLSRQLEKLLAQLNTIQSVRRAKEEQELNDLLDVIEMYESREETFDPAEHGFVFSEQQIQAGIRARNRNNLILEAFEYE